VLRLRRLLRRKPQVLRSVLLREGYLYASDPKEAHALVAGLKLVDLFDEPEIYLQRGTSISRLTRHGRRHRAYRYAGGPSEGAVAQLLFGDRVAATRDELADPLHRDLVELADREGFDRIEPLHLAANRVVARLRYGDTWVRALLRSRGARLQLLCLDGSASVRRLIATWRRSDAPRRRALARLRATVHRQVLDQLPFDRPRGETTAERDGQLRPLWWWAYRKGLAAFRHEEQSYPVFAADGHPLPPQMCVDLVLDSYERAAGTWFRPRGEPPKRVVAALDFDALGIKNRRGVLAFELFASEHPELFERLRLRPEQRIKFRERARFFNFLLSHAECFVPGDMVAIQGKKQDGLVHQHAILIERTDPATGFPYGLADQMHRPRHRPRPALLARLAPRPSRQSRQ
jgi:hypothetical protein